MDRLFPQQQQNIVWYNLTNGIKSWDTKSKLCQKLLTKVENDQKNYIAEKHLNHKSKFWQNVEIEINSWQKLLTKNLKTKKNV